MNGVREGSQNAPWWARFHHTSPWVITCVTLIGAYALTALGILPIMVGSWVEFLGFDEQTAGFIGSATLIGLTAGMAVAIKVFSHLSNAQLALGGIVVAVVFDGLSILAETPILLGVLRFGAGFGYGLALIAVMSWIGRHESADRCFGALMLLQIMIFAPMLVVIPILESAIGRSASYICLIGFGLMSFILHPLLNLNAVKKNDDGSTGQSGLFAPREAEQKSNRQTGLTIAAVAAPSIFLTAVIGLWAYLARYGLSLGIEKEMIGSVLGGVTLVGIPASGLVIWSGNRFGRLVPVVFGILTVLLPVSAFYLGFNSFWIYVAATGAITFGWSYAFPYMQAVQSDLDPSGRLVAIALIPQSIGSAVGPSAFAIALGADSYSAGFLLAMILLGVSMIIALPPILEVRRRERL